MEKTLLYDTTLRDGMQGENIFFSPEDKVKIAKRLDDSGIHYIEGGWPGSNPGAQHFFEMVKDMEFKNAKIAAFGSTRRQEKPVDKDANILALINSGAPVITIFGKSWDLHIESIMQNTKKENLAMIKESIAYLLDHDREVLYSGLTFRLRQTLTLSLAFTPTMTVPWLWPIQSLRFMQKQPWFREPSMVTANGAAMRI